MQQCYETAVHEQRMAENNRPLVVTWRGDWRKKVWLLGSDEGVIGGRKYDFLVVTKGWLVEESMTSS